MKFNISHVIEGWRNHLFPPERLKELIEETSESRMKICRECEFNSVNMTKAGKSFSSSWRPDEHCTVCFCPLQQATKALHKSCPLDPPKWERVATDDESAEIINALTDAEKRTNQETS
jgi:hypothetical protein